MPRASPYIITLSRDERAILERRARKYTLPYFQVLRARIVLAAAGGRGNDGALACDLPAPLCVPLSRLSTADVVREAQRAGIVATVSDKTVWRWLHEDAIRPGRHRTGVFPREPHFAGR